MDKVFISGNVPSSKNSKRVFAYIDKKTKRAKGCLVASETTEKYLELKGIKEYSSSKKTVKVIKNRVNTFENEAKDLKNMIKGLQKPVKLGFYFVRGTRHKFDYHNMCQLPLDLLTAHNIIKDDNMEEVIPVFLGYKVDKNNPGVFVVVCKSNKKRGE